MTLILLSVPLTFFVDFSLFRCENCSFHAYLFLGSFTTNLDREFVLTFPPNPAERNIELLIQTPVSDREVVVNIVTPSGVQPAVNTQVTVTSTTPGSVILPSGLRPSSGTGVDQKSVVVTSSDVITVTVLAAGSCSAFLSLPVDGAGSEYYGVTWWNYGADNLDPDAKSQILVTAVRNPTNVSLLLPRNEGVSVKYRDKLFQGGDTIVEYLAQYQSFQLEGQFDLTGTHITSEEPDAVFSGNIKARIGRKSISDNTMEQLPSTSTWGTQFVILPAPNDKFGSFVKMVAMKENTIITISGHPNTELKSPGDFGMVELTPDTHAFIQSNNPVQVIFFTKGSDTRPAVLAPAAIVVPPTEQFLNSYSFKTASDQQKSYTNTLVIAIKRHHISGIRLNEKNLERVKWRSIAGSDYVGGRITLKSVANKLEHVNKDVTMMAHVFGVSIDDCAYAFPAGMNLKNMQPVSDYFSACNAVSSD